MSLASGRMPSPTAITSVATITTHPSAIVPSVTMPGAATGPVTTPALNSLGGMASTGEDGPVVLGSSTTPIPRKLAERIWKGEYVPVADLLPEALRSSGEDEEERKKRKKKKGKDEEVQNIATWVLGFSAYVGVMAKRHPEKVADLMDYMAQIVQASRQFKGAPWAKYDTAHRMQAAATKREGLSLVDTTLRAITFAQAEAKEACKWCASYDHHSFTCMEKPPESSSEGPAPKKQRFAGNTCYDFNDGSCRRRSCSFRHDCSRCGGPHPEVRCSDTKGRGRARWGTYLSRGWRGW